MAIPAQSVSPPAALGPDQIAELQRATAAYRPVKRAAGVAKSSAITTAVIAGGTLVWGVLAGDGMALLAGLLLSGIATVEFIGCRRLLAADVTAPRFLARNQLAFLALIALYCVCKILTFSAANLKNEALSPEARAELSPAPEYAQMIDQSIDQYGALVYRGFYALVLLLSVGFQGGMAWYYARREKAVAAYCEAAPPSVRQVISNLRT